MKADRFTTYGLYLSQSVHEALGALLYEEAGVVDLETYFDPSESAIPAGDPGAEATHETVSAVVSEFATLYDAADFVAAEAVDHDAFVLTHLAAEPETVASARERFEAAATLQETDLRTVHTAVLEAWLSMDGRA
ncbi:hypothetical protein [Natronobacterium gregoryi]|uniref:Uncharacterized protein n=2 Tax=Natronobacterium gregoryi TaxID=44930 RepID=L0AJZ1_NATGS|nr:hypothetical protein [Natronobacterium gregoryi]AFZ74203.1 hypothetical protein Natgr_3069 [Natronobacterium gregoryi SP2]ELY63658.1 hypothetical protein C490_15449 [Natronobacterium gregoryi SP2]PLK22007.1 hypothetical protein CYV19_01030 [Natronobacterium gregoryi SP2]SFI51415.1 hypothetical protein SAMN05443661_10189 [Natronobacterium gregoryi]